MRRRPREPANKLAAPTPSKAMAAICIGRLAAPVNGSTPPPGVDESPPRGPPGAEEDPPTPAVVVVSLLVVVSSEVEVAPVVEVAFVVVVSPVVVVVPPEVVVVGAGTQPVTQKTLCLTSAPWEPSALMVSLTWKPWVGWGGDAGEVQGVGL